MAIGFFVSMCKRSVSTTACYMLAMCKRKRKRKKSL